MGVKDWSPLIFKYMLVHGTIEENMDDSSLIMVPAADLKEIDRLVDDAMGMGADICFIFEKNEDAAIWDEGRGRYIERPSWKLIRTI